MQLTAFITVNGSKPSRVVYPFTFEKGKVADLCIFAATKTSSPPDSSFKVTFKESGPLGEPLHWNVASDVDLLDGAEMYVTIEPPSDDGTSFRLSPENPAAAASSQAQSSTPGASQTFLDTSIGSFFDDSSNPSSSSTQRSSTAVPISIVAPASPGAATDPPLPIFSPTAILTSVYYSRRQEIQDAFDAMMPTEPVCIKNIDVHTFFDHPLRKTGLFVLLNPLENTRESIAAAKVVCKRGLVELLLKAYPDAACSIDAVKPATSFLAEATGNTWFSDLRASNGSHLIMNSFRQRQRRTLDADNLKNPLTPAAKKRKLIQHIDPQDLDAAAVALSRASNAKQTKELVIQTAQLRCSWLQNLEHNNAMQIPETFMKKFPCFMANASLLHEDYKCNMQLRNLPVAAFDEAFKKKIPAIFALAKSHLLLPSDTPCPTDSDADAWLACKLLINLVPKYCKKNKCCKPERLFLEAWDSSHLNTMHQQRREMKQTAPMIYVITTYPSTLNAYYVSTDDIALKVPGCFLDALQSLMELHYVFDLSYAKELKPFFTLLEKMAGVNTNRAYSILSDLQFDLNREADLIEEAALYPPAADATVEEPPTEASEPPLEVHEPPIEAYEPLIDADGRLQSPEPGEIF